MTLVGSTTSQGRYTLPLAVIGIGLVIGVILGSMPSRVPDAAYTHSEEGDPMLGNPEALVTITEYSDFQCPFCERFFTGAYSQILEQYVNNGKVRFIYKDFPLSFHENAQKAAEAAECADEQNMFFAMHDKIFENQSKMTVADLKKYAQELKLNMSTFNNCLDSGAMAAEVQQDIADATALGVNATPYFFVNNQVIRGAKDFAGFKTILDAELAAADAILGGTAPAPAAPAPVTQ